MSAAAGGGAAAAAVSSSRRSSRNSSSGSSASTGASGPSERPSPDPLYRGPPGLSDDARQAIPGEPSKEPPEKDICRRSRTLGDGAKVKRRGAKWYLLGSDADLIEGKAAEGPKEGFHRIFALGNNSYLGKVGARWYYVDRQGDEIDVSHWTRSVASKVNDRFSDDGQSDSGGEKDTSSGETVSNSNVRSDETTANSDGGVVTRLKRTIIGLLSG